MKFARFKTIAVIAIVLGLLGVSFWVSRIPYRESSKPVITTPLKPIFLVITSPTNRVVSTPVIQLRGLVVGDVSSIAYDLANSEGYKTNQGNYVISWSPGPEEAATNRFECLDIPLSKGTNLIDVHAFFDDGRALTNRFVYELDYRSLTNPPAIQILWPSNKTSIAGSTFTLQAQVADPSITIHVSMSNPGTPTLEFDDATVERNGKVTVKDLPIESGTNVISVLAKDVVGNSSVTNLNIYGSPVKITVRPVNFGRFNQQSITVSGTINDANLTVYVNGRQATVSTNGQWKADGVNFARTRVTHPFRRDFGPPGYRSGVEFYITVSAFKEKAMIATQRFEAEP